MSKLKITAVAGVKEGNDQKGFNVPIFVSATNEEGQGVTGFKTGQFALELLSPSLDREERKLFEFRYAEAKELGNGYYKLICKNANGTGFLNGQVVLSLAIKKNAIEYARTFVSFIVA